MSNLESGSQPSRANLIEGARLAAELERRQVRKRCSKSLISFIEEFWPIVEPNREFVRGWALEAICEHLEAVSAGEINRLLMNVPPGFMKSLATDVFWPAWEWGPLGLPSNRYLAFSYSSDLTERDNQRFGAVVSSRKYQELWGRKVILPSHALGAQKVSNRQTGWKIASSVGGVGTGERADRVLIDDPHNVKMAESEAVRQETVRWFRESITSRMNDAMESAIIVIMQRVHEEDVSGVILDEMEGYCHLCIPMEFDGAWRGPTAIGWEDPREEEGELAFPERFPPAAVVRDKQAMGPNAAASQFQQTPTPRSGNIIERDWWKVWPPEEGDPSYGHVTNPSAFPPCSLIVGSVDTAYGEKDENAFNAMTVWGVWEDHRERPKTVLMEAWRARLPLRGVIPDDAKTDDERKPHWGLAEKVADTIRRRQIDVVLIENKTRGGDLAAEIRRLLRQGECQTIMIEPRGDKVARLHAVQAMFADGMVYAPQRVWAEAVITEVAQFPKAKYADYCLVAGTLVATRRGNVPIENVRPGDECITPAGWRRVTAAGQTGVCPVTSAKGVTGTFKHPIFTFDAGFARLDTISQASAICRLTICDLTRIIRLNESNSMAGLTNVWADKENITWRKRHGPNEKRVTNRKDCMLRSGWQIQVWKCRQTMKSITKIAIHSIAALRIWSAYRRVCIGTFLSDMGQRSWFNLRKSALSPSLGIGRTPDANGIERMLSRVWPKLEPLLNSKSHGVRAFGVEQKWWERIAVKNSALLYVKDKKADGAEAGTNSNTPITQPVFNVTVEGEGCYFANGVLVHNTDTVSQCLSWLRNSGALLLGTEADSENLARNTFRSKPRVQYDV